MNLTEIIKQIKSDNSWVESKRKYVEVFKSDMMVIMLVGLCENSELKPHKANGIISVQVLEGKIEFSAEEQSTRIEMGQIITLDKNITHSVTALTESFFLITKAIDV